MTEREFLFWLKGLMDSTDSATRDHLLNIISYNVEEMIGNKKEVSNVNIRDSGGFMDR